jgi:hypothetical protein
LGLSNDFFVAFPPYAPIAMSLTLGRLSVWRGKTRGFRLPKIVRCFGGGWHRDWSVIWWDQPDSSPLKDIETRTKMLK